MSAFTSPAPGAAQTPTALDASSFTRTPGRGHSDPVVRYAMAARLDPAAGILAARAAISLPEAVVGAEGRVLLDPGAGEDGRPRLQVRSVATPDGPSLPTDSANGLIAARIPLGTREIEVSWTLPLDPAGLDPFGYHLFMSIEPGSYWYPDIVRPDGTRDRFRDFDVTLEVPEGWAVITSGGTGTRGPGPGGFVTRFRAEHVEGFALAAGKGFRTEAVERGGVPIAAFYHPDHADAFGEVIERTAEAAAWYRETYGFFPIPVVGILQGHPRWGGGFPLPNLFMVHLGGLRPDFLSFITAHELGHYYWGLTVLGDRERLDWLMLANGIWADQLYLARAGGRTVEEQWRLRGQGDWILDFLTAVAANREQRLGITESEDLRLGFDYNSLIRHGKAATGLYLQSRLLGFDRMLQVQRDLLRDYRNRPLSVEEFVRRLTDAGLPDAPAFFAEWQRGDAMIGARVSVVEPDVDGFRVVLSRTGRVPFPVDAVVRMEDGGTVDHVMPAGATSDTIRVPSRPAGVFLDPDGVIPMWNSSNSGMRSLIAEALLGAGRDEEFLSMARALVAEAPDDRMMNLLAGRLFRLGRWDETVDLWPAPYACATADRCRAGIAVARALHALGRGESAIRALDALEAGSSAAGIRLAWQQARDEVGR